MPNRFELGFPDQASACAAAEQAREALNEAWRSVADAVWAEYLAPVVDAGHGGDTAAIWQRQVDGFWELSWVVAEPGAGERTLGRLAAGRKAFRDVSAAPEPGIKCSLMGHLQELSGTSGSAQRQFWAAVDRKVGEVDLKKSDDVVTERLCAIALIKRLFPRVIEKAVAGAGGQYLAEQWRWPSTAFFAARPWLDHVHTSSHAGEARSIAQQATDQRINSSERDAAAEAGLAHWAGVDANLWFPEILCSTADANEWGVDGEVLRELASRVESLCRDKLRAWPSTHYALLLMDGDHVGRVVSELGDPGVLSRRLASFASDVEAIVRERRGRTVYAGGDDVLALLPAGDARAAADALHRAYADAFAGSGATSATLSGAIVFAHWKYPLRLTLQTAHTLLDDDAKAAVGRDALAFGAIQGGGINARWAAPWPVIRGQVEPLPALKELLPWFSDAVGSDAAEAPRFNASFLYHLRDQFARLLGTLPQAPGSYGALPAMHQRSSNGELDLLGEVAHAEYRRRLSRDERHARPPLITRATVEPLVALGRRWRWCNHESGARAESEPATFGFDGWRVARLLATLEEQG